MDVPSRLLSRVAISMYGPSKENEDPEGEGGGEEDQSFSKIYSSDLYPPQKTVVDEGCPQGIHYFPLLCGEYVEYIGGLGLDHYVALSSYRFFASQKNGFYNIPVGLIELVEITSSKDQMLIFCKDARSFCLTFDTPTSCRTWYERLSQCLRGAKDLPSTFAFVHKAWARDQHSNTSSTSLLPSFDNDKEEGEGELMPLSPALIPFKVCSYQDGVVMPEYHRLAMDLDSAWRITECNNKYEICPTYPKLFVVPRSVTDEELMSAAKFRTLGRIPAIVWRHPTNGSVIARSSQPLVGVLSWRSSEDERLLLAISHACARHDHPHPRSTTTGPGPIPNGAPPWQVMQDRGMLSSPLVMANGNPGNGVMPHNNSSSSSSSSFSAPSSSSSSPPTSDVSHVPELLVIDLRSYTAVLGNRAKGGGCECQDYYPNCEIQYKGLSNIHSVRKSFQQLRNVLLYDDEPNFLSNLENTRWLYYLSQLISVATDVVRAVNDKGCPVLVHCSDGWDRTAQVVPLAELLLDPYYRTIEGFQVLIEREWLGFGHRFSDRCGHTLACADSSQRCPIFLQWLDCVHQLLLQFPCDFQFNQNFLVKLGVHSYSCLFGTLLGNCMKERDEAQVSERTVSLWAFLHAGNTDFINHLYQTTAPPQVLYPVPHMHKMQLWSALYTSPTLTHTPKPRPPSVGVEGGDVTSPAGNSNHHKDRRTREEEINGGRGGGRGRGEGGGGGIRGEGGGVRGGGGEQRGEKVRQGERESSKALTRDGSGSHEPTHPQPATVTTAAHDASEDSKMIVPVELAEMTSLAGKPNISESLNSESSFKSVSSSSPTPRENGVQEGEKGGREGEGGGGGGGGEGRGRGGGGEGVGEEVEGTTVINGELLNKEQAVGESKANERETAPNSTEEDIAPKHTQLTMPSETPTHTLPPTASSSLSSSTTLTTTSERQVPFTQYPADLPNAQTLNTMDTSLLHDAMHDHSPQLQHTLLQAMSSIEHSTAQRHREDTMGRGGGRRRRSALSAKWGLDLDGLSCTCSEADQRLSDILGEYEAKIADLRHRLALAKAAAAAAVVCSAGNERKGGRTEEEGGETGKEEIERNRVCNTEEDQPSSSLNSWDCVDHRETDGVRWVPDHAVTHCHSCGVSFSLIIRKHHCRSCGGVFCNTCSDFMCPVPAEQLFTDVRVCSKCYYRLDGHLRPKSTEPN